MKTAKATELDRMVDNGEDITEFLDIASARRINHNQEVKNSSVSSANQFHKEHCDVLLMRSDSSLSRSSTFKE